MTDGFYWEVYEELIEKLDRKPTHEEILEVLNNRYKGNTKLNNEINNWENFYGTKQYK